MCRCTKTLELYKIQSSFSVQWSPMHLEESILITDVIDLYFLEAIPSVL